MYPSRRRAFVISTLRRDVGTSTLRCLARHALRTQVRKSAIGSVTDMSPPASLSRLPAGLHDARDLARQGELPEADPAESKTPEIGARPPATAAAIVAADLELR